MPDLLSWKPLRTKWKSLPPSKRKAVLKRLSSEQVNAISWFFVQYAREKQLPPGGWWLVWLIMAGRGWGKTRVGAEWVIERAKEGKGPIGLIGETAGDVRDLMVETGPSSIMKVSPPGFRPNYEPSKRRLTWPNGVTATTFSGDKPDQLRGPNLQTVWADEPAKWRYATEAWDNMEFALRDGADPRVVATTTPRPIDLIKNLVEDEDCVVTSGSTDENKGNLAPSFRKRIYGKYEGTRLGRQELHAELLTDTPGALWTYEQIEDLRVESPPAMKRIVVAIDPAVSSSEDSDETGIVVVGRGVDNKGYVLEDLSGIYSPNGWANRAVKAFDKHEADRIIGEVNNGGDLVESNIRTVRKNAPFKQVRASRGKQVRAEPIAGLYEQRKVFHVGSLPKLEDQMTTWDPATSTKSPDRVDALVWGLTELILEHQSELGGGHIHL